MFRVKICGITNAYDLRMVEESGADAAGFVFFRRSKRYVDFEQCAEMVKAETPSVLLVGVFVNEDPAVINRIAGLVGLGCVQLSGDEDERCVKEIDVPVIKVIRPSSADDVKKGEQFPSEYIMFDSPLPGSFGGTGRQFDYSLILEAGIKRKFLLAGGLTPDNVMDVVSRVGPVGVDVSTGVEMFPGKKDPRKVREFVTRALEALSNDG